MKRWIAALPAALLLLCAGCTPKTVETPPSIPSVLIPDDPAVKTDWSKLTPYEPEKSVYTRRYEEFTDTLIPAGDYGPLVPYLGGIIGKLHGDGYNGGRYGLMTLAGEIVTDPIFSSVWRGENLSGRPGEPPLPYLMLKQGGEPEKWAMAALDGSWCTGFKYDINEDEVLWGCRGDAVSGENGLFARDGNALVYLSATGEELFQEDAGEEFFGDALYSAFRRDGIAYFRLNGSDGPYTALTLATGERREVALDYGQVMELKNENEYPAAQDPEQWYNQTPEGPDSHGGYWLTAPDGEGLRLTVENGRYDWYPILGWDRVTGEPYLCLHNGVGVDFYTVDGDWRFSALPKQGESLSLVDGMIYGEGESGSYLYTPEGAAVFRYFISNDNQV